MRLAAHNAEDWQLTEAPAASGRRRRGLAGAGDGAEAGLPDEFLLEGVEVALARDAKPSRIQRGAAPPPIDVSIQCQPGERAAIAIRHPSGALTFHSSVERVPTRGGRSPKRGAEIARFRIPVRGAAAADPASGRVHRGPITKAVKLIVLKVKEALVDAALRETTKLAARGLEQLWWNHRRLKEGWFTVDAGSLRARKLAPASAAALRAEGRALLFLHGTFSHAAGAFAALANAPGAFFDAVKPLYGDRIFAFNHFSLSKTPADNARELLEGLPANGSRTFDVITHSRGGLVLRQLVERRDDLGALADRFRLGRAVLVAAPNGGTPLATPRRWEETVGFVANVLEAFPDNPWTVAPEFVANGIVWLAGHLSHDLPGLAAMDADADGIASLQRPPGPPPDAYSALVANFNPEGAHLARFIDAGIDSFFAGANDLVVPSEGGWQVDGATAAAIPGERIGCFGPGGNLSSEGGVTHLNFFGRRETVDFLVHSLRGTSAVTTPVDLAKSLPTRRLFRGGATRAAVAASAPPLPPAGPAIEPSPASTGSRRRPRHEAASDERARFDEDDTLHLIILRGRDGADVAQIVAIYGSARVVQAFPTSNPRIDKGKLPKKVVSDLEYAGTRFKKIIDIHESIQMNLEGRSDRTGKVPDLPNDEGLREFGSLLFDAIFHGDVKRLYDAARSEQRDRALNVVFTCTIPWVAAKPWEFAYDYARRKFLATEEVHFIRNVLTPVPAQRPVLNREALQMLVVVAQPLGTAELSTDDEEARIRHNFRLLTDAGLVEIEVLTDATPARLHHALEARELETRAQGRDRRFRIVHFIGHGDFDRDANQGVLIFTTPGGEMHRMRLRELREVLCGRGIQLVFLNACDTARDAIDTTNRGVAQALVEGGLPAVVANQYKVLDPSAIAFAEHFYWSLAHGASLGEAAREARISLNYSVDGEIIDWAVPVLYARDADYSLCPRVREQVAVPRDLAGDAARERARSNARRGLASIPRLAVADLTQAYPGLEDVVEHLNAVQNVAEFVMVKLVLPLGIWRNNGKEKSPYLYADLFAARLANKPAELGVKYLFCITDRPMMGNVKEKGKLVPIHDLYAWGDPEARHKIFVFSMAGFSVPPRGELTNRVFANLLAGAFANDLLQSHLSSNVMHKRKPNECPFYYNPNRDFDQISGRMQFDKDCRKKLEKYLDQEQIEACDAMLSVFFAAGAKRTTI